MTFIKFFSYFSTIYLWNIEYSLPNTPLTEKTNGVKVPCSMFIIRLLYFRLFSFSCFSNNFSVFTLCCDAELVLVILTSKNSFWPSFHTPLTLTSGLELSAGIPLTISPSIGWREGSAYTSVWIFANKLAS